MQHSGAPERWLPVVGYEGHYEVSNHGRVRSLPRSARRRDGVLMHYPGKVMNGGRKAPGGHRAVRLTRCIPEEKPVVKLVHRLVLEAFVGPCPDGMEGCHWDDDPDNNHVSNLRWATRSDNEFDKVRNGNHHAARRTHCKAGHEFTAGNTQLTKTGHRRCRKCARRRNGEYEARVRASRALR